jgi:hypothetical protein
MTSLEARSGIQRKPAVVRISHDRQQLIQPFPALRDSNVELGHVRAQSIVRNAWGNRAPPVDAAMVSRTRHALVERSD